MEIKGMILDLAGTSVDFGSIAPTQAFINVFKEFGLEVKAETVRKFMGLHKKVHLTNILGEDYVKSQWLQIYGYEHNQDNIEQIFTKLGPAMEIAVKEFSDPIPGVIDFMEYYRIEGIKFGSTTGYVREMMNILQPEIESKGLIFDSTVTPDEVPSGRPYPWMVYKNAMNMGTFPLYKMVKIGDTLADIEEGLNAGMWIISISKSGNELGLSQTEINEMPESELNERIEKIEKIFIEKGAHYVAKSVAECYPIIEEINTRIANNEKPY